MQGFVRFNKGLLRMPLPIRAWVTMLLVMNVIVPLFFIRHLEAQVVLGTMALVGTTMGLLTARFGFTRILGLGHFYWFPLLAWLATRLGQHDLGEPLGLWLLVLIAVDTISLVIDVVDVIRYANGDRAETVAGL